MKKSMHFKCTSIRNNSNRRNLDGDLDDDGDGDHEDRNDDLCDNNHRDNGVSCSIL